MTKEGRHFEATIECTQSENPGYAHDMFRERDCCRAGQRQTVAAVGTQNAKLCYTIDVCNGRGADMTKTVGLKFWPTFLSVFS